MSYPSKFSIFYTKYILIRAAFQEMIDFEEMLFNTPYEYNDTVYKAVDDLLTRPEQGKKLYFKDIC